MERKLKRCQFTRLFISAVFVFFTATHPAYADDGGNPGDNPGGGKGCDTRFTNPFSDVAWECMYPIRFAGINISPSGPDPQSKVSKMLCSCQDGALSRIGATIGFHEPARLMDVTKLGLCMAAFGFSLGSESLWGGGHLDSSSGEKTDTYSAQTHYYFFNPLEVMEILMDFSCLEKIPLDVAEMSELDPMSNDDELNMLAFPETILFANPIAILACAADAIAASAGMPIDALYWCAGSWGTVYPLTNKATGNLRTGVWPSALMVSKQLARGHRELLNWGTKGEAAVCGPYPMPIWMKTQYKFQLVQPVVSTQCLPVGRTSLLWEQGKNPPVPGKADNFVYVIWRYRDCCLLY